MSQLILPSSCASDRGAPYIQTPANCKCYKWRHLRFWAFQGRVHVVNESDGEHSSCSLPEFAYRAAVFEAAIDEKMRYGSDKRDHRRLVDLMEICCRDAEAQGDPHDPRQLRDKLAQGRNRVVFGAMSGRDRVLESTFTDATPRYPDGTPLFPPGGPGTVRLPTQGFRL